DMVQRALDHRFRGRIPVLIEQMLFKRSGIHADSNRNAALLASLDNRFDLLAAADVAGIDSNLVDAVLDRGERKTVIEMNVRNERDMNPLLNLSDGVRGFLIVNSDAHDLAAGLFQPKNLGDRRLDIGRLRRAHALDNDFIASADRQAA